MQIDDPLSFSHTWEGFLPPNTVVMARRSVEAPRLAFEAPDLELPEARALFEKILVALDLVPATVVAFPRLPDTVMPGMLVRFVASAEDSARAGAWENLVRPGAKGVVLTTYSLRAMLGNPGLKKPVWAHLKDALTRMKDGSINV